MTPATDKAPVKPKHTWRQQMGVTPAAPKDTGGEDEAIWSDVFPGGGLDW
ncbi:MAG: hypothetical protein KGL39_16920 [Patescibacteria group bacterium]|nr:hypothetical protein [Patescibacteria group bacterium]